MLTLEEWVRRHVGPPAVTTWGGRNQGKTYAAAERINMFYDDRGSWALNPQKARERLCLVNQTFPINSERAETMQVITKPGIHPLTLEAAPKGGYIVRGAMYNAYDDSMRGLAFAGSLTECLDYMSEHMEEGRKAQEPKRVCDCEKAGQ